MILIVDNCWKKDSLSKKEFVTPIENIVRELGEDAKIIHYTEIPENGITGFDKIILCGTALKDNNYLEKIEKFEWITKTEKPVLGICAGMQILGLLFGSVLRKGKEIGMKEIKMVRKNKLFQENLNVYELHGQHVEGGEFETLAKSNYPQAIKHKKKEIYGIMFHPEVRQEKIIKNFISI